MAKQLAYQPLTNLGVNGLNLQNNPASLDASWLTSATNIMLRESGRISFRKGLKQKVVPSGTAIGSLVEHNDQGTNKIFASHGTSIYAIDFTSPNAAFPTTNIDVRHTVANSTGDWQFVNFNNRLHCFHSGVVPQRYDGAAPSLERWSGYYNTTAINLADGGAITAPNIVSGSTYKIASLGNTNFNLIGGDATPAVDEIFTATSAGGDAIAGSAITAPNIVSGKSYKIITLGDTNFTLVGADGSPAVDEIFTADAAGSTVAGTTGTVKEVVSGTTGTVTEIKTNPSLTTITVDSTIGFPVNGKIKIDDEVISYIEKTPTTFGSCTRGADSTTATYHDDNDAVVTATKPAGVTTFDPSCGMGFYGRMYVGGVTEEKDVVYYSVLLDADDFTGTGSGLIDLKTVWGTDEIVSIAPFFGKLVIFGKNNIAIYDNPADIANATLDEVIHGIGLVSRDTVQTIGDDLVFLSDTGLRSLSRTTQTENLPLTDYSLNIKDTLIRTIGLSTNVKSIYLENEGVYLLSFVDKNITYAFDFKHFTPNKAPRITQWFFNLDREPASLAYTKLYSGLLVGQKDGSIAGYEGYFDTDLAWDSGVSYTNAPFTSDISSVWINLGEGIQAALLKNMILVLEGGSGAKLYLKWYKDFSASASDITTINLRPATTGTTSLYGASSSLYGTTVVAHTHDATVHPSNSLYSPIYGFKEYRTPLVGSAKHLKINMSIESNGYDASIQDLTLLHKEGKIR